MCHFTEIKYQRWQAKPSENVPKINSSHFMLKMSTIHSINMNLRNIIRFLELMRLMTFKSHQLHLLLDNNHLYLSKYAQHKNLKMHFWLQFAYQIHCFLCFVAVWLVEWINKIIKPYLSKFWTVNSTTCFRTLSWKTLSPLRLTRLAVLVVFCWSYTTTLRFDLNFDFWDCFLLTIQSRRMISILLYYIKTEL